jgi:hypothetical protein
VALLNLAFFQTVHCALEPGTAVGSLEACIFEIMALNKKNILNLLTNFLRSFQIHKGPTSDIGLLYLFFFLFLLLNGLIVSRLRSRQSKRLSRDFNSLVAHSCKESVNALSQCAYESHSPTTSAFLNMFMGLNAGLSSAHWLL